MFTFWFWIWDLGLICFRLCDLVFVLVFVLVVFALGFFVLFLLFFYCFIWDIFFFASLILFSYFFWHFFLSPLDIINRRSDYERKRFVQLSFFFFYCSCSVVRVVLFVIGTVVLRLSYMSSLLWLLLAIAPL